MLIVDPADVDPTRFAEREWVASADPVRTERGRPTGPAGRPAPLLVTVGPPPAPVSEES